MDKKKEKPLGCVGKLCTIHGTVFCFIHAIYVLHWAAVHIIKIQTKSCYVHNHEQSNKKKNLLTQVNSSKAATTLVVKKASYIRNRQINAPLDLLLNRTESAISKQGNHIKMQIKASKIPYMVVGMIRGLHFNRDLNQVGIQTPSEIKNELIRYSAN